MPMIRGELEDVSVKTPPKARADATRDVVFHIDSTHANWQTLVVPMRYHSCTKDILQHERCKTFNLL